MNGPMWLVVAWGVFCIGCIVYFGWIKEEQE